MPMQRQLVTTEKSGQVRWFPLGFRRGRLTVERQTPLLQDGVLVLLEVSEIHDQFTLIFKFGFADFMLCVIL